VNAACRSPYFAAEMSGRIPSSDSTKLGGEVVAAIRENAGLATLLPSGVGWGGEWVGGPMERCWSPERPLVNQRAEGIGDQRCPATEDVAEEDTTEVVVH